MHEDGRVWYLRPGVVMGEPMSDAGWHYAPDIDYARDDELPTFTVSAVCAVCGFGPIYLTVTGAPTGQLALDGLPQIAIEHGEMHRATFGELLPPG